MLVAEGQRPSGMALLEIVWKTMAPKPNSLEASRSIQKTLLGSWCTRVEGRLKASWMLLKNASSCGVGEPSFVLEA